MADMRTSLCDSAVTVITCRLTLFILPVTFVQRYYSLLPANTDAAFALLGPRARAQAGGAAGFKTFYARMQSVTLHDPRRIADGSVDATVRFVQKDGTTSSEPYRFVITEDGSGKMMMESFTRM